MCLKHQMGMLPRDPQDAFFRVSEGAGYQEKREVTPKRGSEAKPVARTDSTGTDVAGIGAAWPGWGRGWWQEGDKHFAVPPPVGWWQPWGCQGGSLPRRPRDEGVAAKRSHPVVPGVAGSSCKNQTAPLAHSTGTPGRADTPAPSHLHPAHVPARSR